MKQILLELADGRLAYSRPCAALLPDETQAQYLARIAARLLETFPGATVHGYVDDDEIPTDATSWKYRDAWRFDGNGIAVDLDQAKAIAMAALRRERNARLQALDVDEMRFAADAKKLGEVREQKAALRDAPIDLSVLIKAATSIEAIESVRLPD
jgi:hypothetical protein